MVSYDPAFAYELAHIIENGLQRMYGPDPENIYYYITIYNEPYVQPAEPEGLDVDGLLRGIYRYRRAPRSAPTGPSYWPRGGDAVGAAGRGAAGRRVGRGRRRGR